jgi:hypothetical protein
MRDLSRDSNLVVELCEPGRIVLQFGREEFQRDRLTESQIIGSINFTHSAAAKETDDSVPVAENRARREAAVTD